MLHKAIQVRFYSTPNQKIQLALTFGGAGWWWNYHLNKLIEVYKKTGKKLGCSALNTLLPDLKKSDRSAWLGECYSQFLQAKALKITTAYKNFFHKPAGFLNLKSEDGKHSVQYPHYVEIVKANVKFIRNIGIAKPKIHKLIENKIHNGILSKNY